MDISQSLDSYTTNFLKNVQELTENDTMMHMMGGRMVVVGGDELGISFWLPIVIPSLQRIWQFQKHNDWIPLSL